MVSLSDAAPASGVERDLEEASETTPLLSPREDVRYIHPEVNRLLVVPNIQDELSRDGEWTTVDFAYDTLVLLHLRAALRSPARPALSRSADNMSADELTNDPRLQHVEHTLVHEHERVAAALDFVPVEEYLMASFLLNEKSGQRIRLIDLLGQKNVHESPLRTRNFQAALLAIWNRGHTAGLSKKGFVPQITRRLRAFCTPRVMHMLDLVLFLLYFAALVHYAILPPVLPGGPVQHLRPGMREVFIMVYASAQLFSSWDITIVPFIFTLLAFLACLPSVPRPQDGAYSVVLFTVSLHLLQMHLPRSPSPLMLFPFDLALPLAALVQHGIFRVFIPVIAFFLPALLLALFLLSTSLSDILMHLSANFIANASPLEARTAFLTLLAVLFILLLCSLMMLILVYPNLSSQDPLPARWDRFSRPIGSEARRAMVAVIAKYSQPAYFPPPLNLAHFILIRIPSWVWGSLGRTRWQGWMSSIEDVLWLALVAPVAFAVSVLYLWGYVP